MYSSLGSLTPTIPAVSSSSPIMCTSMPVLNELLQFVTQQAGNDPLEAVQLFVQSKQAEGQTNDEVTLAKNRLPAALRAQLDSELARQAAFTDEKDFFQHIATQLRIAYLVAKAKEGRIGEWTAPQLNGLVTLLTQLVSSTNTRLETTPEDQRPRVVRVASMLSFGLASKQARFIYYLFVMSVEPSICFHDIGQTAWGGAVQLYWLATVCDMDATEACRFAHNSQPQYKTEFLVESKDPFGITMGSTMFTTKRVSIQTEMLRWLLGESLTDEDQFKLGDKLLKALKNSALLNTTIKSDEGTQLQTDPEAATMAQGEAPVDLCAWMEQARKEEDALKAERTAAGINFMPLLGSIRGPPGAPPGGLRGAVPPGVPLPASSSTDEMQVEPSPKKQKCEDDESKPKDETETPKQRPVKGFPTNLAYVTALIAYYHARKKLAQLRAVKDDKRASQVRNDDDEDDTQDDDDEEEEGQQVNYRMQARLSRIGSSYNPRGTQQLQMKTQLNKAENKVRSLKAKIAERLEITVTENGLLPRLERVARAMKLDEFEKLVLVALIDHQLKSQEVDPWTGEQIKEYTALRLLDDLCDSMADRITFRRYFYKTAKLVKNGFITVRCEDISGNFKNTIVSIDRRFNDFLLGLDTEFCEVVEGSHLYFPTTSTAQVILPETTKDLIMKTVTSYEEFQEKRRTLGFDDTITYGNGVVLLFYGPSGTGKTMMANALANSLGKRVLLINFPTLGVMEADQLLKLVFREALVNNALLFFDECEKLFETRDKNAGGVNLLLTEIERFSGITILATNRPYELDEAMRRRITLPVEFKEPDHNLREKIWNTLIPKEVSLHEDVDFKVLSMQYELSGGLIKNAVLTALCEAVGRKEEVPKLRMDDFHQGCKLQLAGTLAIRNFYHKVTPKAGLEAVLVSETIKKLLQDVVKAEKARKVLTGTWGFLDVAATQGITVLFSGPPGTGKTLSASAIGFEVGKPLKVVNSSQLVSKYVGETSKNLETVFTDAKGNGAVLVFDEAEGLFGSRHGTEGSSTDRYANCDVGNLLYQMEHFPGVVVLITNAESNIDNAFFRRIKYHVKFEAPTTGIREQLWKNHIPEKCPLADDINFTALAQAELSGGHIKSAVFRAACRAAVREGKDAIITHKDLQAAAQEEVSKIQGSAAPSMYL